MINQYQPDTHAEATEVDKINVDTKWDDTEQLLEYNAFMDKGKDAQDGLSMIFSQIKVKVHKTNLSTCNDTPPN